MSRALLALLGCMGLAGAALLHEPPSAGAGGLAAFGASLGGWRVLAVDALYLRAEALRAQGRAEDLPPLYRAIVELDPGNEAATDALAAALSAQIHEHAAAQDAATTLAWWQEAWGMVRGALETRTSSATLAFRASDLLLDVAAATPALEQAVDAQFRGAAQREALGLGYLLAAARLAEHLPRTGRAHLVRLARRGPEVAAAALARGRPDAEVLTLLAAAEELATLHPAAMAAIEVLGAPLPGASEGRAVPLAEHLAGAGRLLRAALAWRAGAPREAFDRALAEQAPREAPAEGSLTGRLAAWAAPR